MKISDLKLPRIRKVISVDVNGKTENITIFNLLGEKRGEMLGVLQDMTSDKTRLDDEDIEAIFNMLFPICTDIVIDESIVNAINNPSNTMITVINEVLEICNELYLEILYYRLREVEELEQAMMTKYILLKTKRIDMLGRDCYSLEKEIKDIERIENRLDILKEKKRVEKEIEMEKEEMLEGE